MTLDPALARLLADPADHGPLLIIGDAVLYNPRLRHAYPIVDGIPALIEAEAIPVTSADHERYLAGSRPWTGA
jgi:uncharacterized protein YbaR (Trm112 family)